LVAGVSYRVIREQPKPASSKNHAQVATPPNTGQATPGNPQPAGQEKTATGSSAPATASPAPAAGLSHPANPPRAATNRGSGTDNARRRQDVRLKPTERPGGIASSGLLPGAHGWNFRPAHACCHSPFSGQHWRQKHWLLDCGGGQSVGAYVLNATPSPVDEASGGFRTFSMYGR
jgi:hypothetical protein